MGISIIRTNSDSRSKFVDCFLVISILRQDQAGVVVSLGIVRA